MERDAKATPLPSIHVAKYASGRFRYYHEHPGSPWRLERRGAPAGAPVLVEFRAVAASRWECPECRQVLVEEELT